MAEILNNRQLRRLGEFADREIGKLRDIPVDPQELLDRQHDMGILEGIQVALRIAQGGRPIIPLSRADVQIDLDTGETQDLPERAWVQDSRTRANPWTDDEASDYWRTGLHDRGKRWVGH